MKWLIVFLFGMIWGSFFFTLSARYLNGSFAEDKVKALFSVSKCPKCQHKIQPLYLIPIIGYIILRGRCKDCGKRISPLYPIFEILFGILSVIIAFKYGENLYSVLMFLILGLAIVISIIDMKILTIPDSLLIVFFLLSIYPIILNNSFKNNIYGFLFMGLFFIVILLILPGGFGGGDVKFASAIGILFGIELSVVVLEVALISGSIIGIIYGFKTKRGLRIKIPFAPFLTLGVLISILFGDEIIFYYYSLLF